MTCKEIALLTILFSTSGLLVAQENPPSPVGQRTSSQTPASDTKPPAEQGPAAQQPAAAQPAPAAQTPEAERKVLATCASGKLNNDAAEAKRKALESSFGKDTRSPVRAFKEELSVFYASCITKGIDSSAIRDALEDLRLSGVARTGTTMLNPGLSLVLLQGLAADVTNSAYSDLAAEMNAVRPDKQLSAQASSSGTTSLVSKAGGAALLALAVDSGALTQSVSGTTNTVSGNLEGIGSLLVGRAPISVDPTNQNKLRTIAGLVNLAATFTLAQPSSESTSSTEPATGTSPPAGTAVTIPSSVGKLTGITAQFVMHNHFDPHSATFQSNWKTINGKLSTASATVLQGSNAIVGDLECADCQTAWTTFEGAASEGIAQNNPDAVSIAFDTYVNATIAAAKAAHPNFGADVATAAKAASVYQGAVQTAVNNAVGNLFTLEYDFAKAANQPEMHTFKLVYGNATNGNSGITSILDAGANAKSLFTANMGVSIYGGTIPASAKYGRLYDGQVSAEFDVPIALASATKPSVFSLAGYWQYQPSPSVLNITQNDLAPGTTIDASSQVLVGTSGSLWVTQAKITVGGGKSGVTIPIGVKWSNKTDLVTGNKIGGQIGINYDLSGLSSLFGGAK
jgi:hypothetical protein